MSAKKDIYTESVELHEEHRGKIEVYSKVPLKNRHDLSLAYTPGVAEVCREIARNKDLAYKYTLKANTIAIVSDGSRALPGMGVCGNPCHGRKAFSRNLLSMRSRSVREYHNLSTR